MKKLILIIALILLTIPVNADKFIHEGDHNYTVNNVAMTTQPFLNGNLLLTFNLLNENGSPANNTHTHLFIFDDRNVLVNDYSVKLVSTNQLEKVGLNLTPIQNSQGHTFYRLLDNKEKLAEYRFVSDDNGFISVGLFLNACGVNEVKNCYYQTGNYRLEIQQTNLRHSENFIVESEKINTNFIISSTVFLANNSGAIVLIVLFGLILFGIAVAIFWFVRRKFKGG